MRLRNCPFCGGNKTGISEKSVSRDHGTSTQYQVAVYCNSCHTYGPRVLTEKVKNKYPEPPVDFSKARKKAIEAWNRRFSDDLMERMEDDG